MKKPLELYIHIPFCVRKCRYCDFLSAPADSETRARYVGALCNAIKTRGEEYPDYVISSIFVGGGTPTSLEPEQLKAIFKALRGAFEILPEAEISVECNPGTLTFEKLSVLKASGVNRLSIGLQSAFADELATLGRIHSYEDFEANFRLAREMGFDNINVDIMQSLPGQTMEKAMGTLNKVIALSPEHISVYSLIIEDGTPFYKEFGNHPELLPDEDTEREIYWKSHDVLEHAGYVHYEISNYAKPGRECRHNIGYWECADYLGIGSGAASLLDGRRFTDESFGTGLFGLPPADESEKNVPVEPLTPKERMSEYMFLGLRMLRGVSISEFERRFGKSMYEVYGDIIDRFIKQNLLIKDEDYIRLSKRGLDVSNSVMCEFV